MAFRILIHSLGLIVRNLGAAFRGLWPIVAILGCVEILLEFAPFFKPKDSWSIYQPLSIVEPQPSIAKQIWFSTAAFVIYPIYMVYFYISWHRQLLLSENISWLPKPRVKLFFAYIFKNLISGLFILLISALTIVICYLFFRYSTLYASELFHANFTDTLTLVFFIAFLFAYFVIATALSFVLFLTLPAAALGQKLSIVQALRLSRPHFWTLLGVAAFLVLITAALYGLSVSFMNFMAIDQNNITIYNPLVIMNFFISPFIFITALTTLYAHVVEKRALF